MKNKDNISKMLSVYFIAGTQDVVKATLPEVLEEALKAGITCFQYREKGANSLLDYQEKKEMAVCCQKLCQKYQVPFIINDDVILALEIAADGIHIGQDDMTLDELNTIIPARMIVGLSCHQQDEVIAGNLESAVDYFGIGPVFNTDSKADAQSAIGCKKLRQMTEIATKPVVAIGGIAQSNILAVKKTGVAGISVISAITRADVIAEAVNNLF